MIFTTFFRSLLGSNEYFLGSLTWISRLCYPKSMLKTWFIIAATHSAKTSLLKNSVAQPVSYFKSHKAFFDSWKFDLHIPSSYSAFLRSSSLNFTPFSLFYSNFLIFFKISNPSSRQWLQSFRTALINLSKYSVPYNSLNLSLKISIQNSLLKIRFVLNQYLNFR